MPYPFSRIEMSIPLASSDGKFHARYPAGNAPSSSTPLAGAATDAISASGVLTAPGGGVTTFAGLNGNARYMGVNLLDLNYYTTEFPFINLLKTSDINPTPSTNNAIADVVMDANGYPTTMVGASSATYTGFGMNPCQNAPIALNSASRYPTGPYIYTVTGKGTVVFSGDINGVSAATGSPTPTISGLTVTFTGTGVQSVQLTSNMGGGGLICTTTALPDAANNLRAMSLCQSSLNSAYLAGGSMFNPTFKSALAPYSRIRFMDWERMNVLTPSFSVTAAATATSATVAAWPRATGTYYFTFSNGDQRNVSCTWNSTTISWTGGLTSAVTGANFAEWGPWANRPKASDCSYHTYRGVPAEVCMQLCNEIATDMHWCLPISIDMDSTHVPGLANLAYDGTGGTISGFAGLRTDRKIYLELANEIWNNFTQHAWANNCGNAQFPTAPDGKVSNYIGKWQATASDAFYTQYGSTAYAARVFSGMPIQTAQGNGPYYGTKQMLSPYWTSAAWTHHINGWWMAPYMRQTGPSRQDWVYPAPVAGVSTATFQYTPPAAGTYQMMFSNGDTRTVTVSGSTMTFSPALSSAPFGSNVVYSGDIYSILTSSDPLTTWFNLAYSNTYGGVTYSSLPAAGWVGDTINNATSLCGQLNPSQPWGNIPILGYESGTNDGPQADGIWSSMLISANRDNRMEYIHYDPNNLLYATYGITSANGQPGYLPAMLTSGFQSINQFNNCGPPNKYGNWGAMESILTPFSPLSSAPPKYRGIVKFAQNI